MNNNGKYDDIINLPHHVSKKHPQMGVVARSAQFAPFAALTGYEDEVKETARLTDSKKDIDEEQKQVLDRKLQLIKQKIHTKPEVTITYFIPDLKKDGGEYVTVTGNIRKIDEFNQLIIMQDETEIYIEDVIEIWEDILKSVD